MQVQKSKAGTGRVVSFRELGLVNAYTLEASFCGPATGPHARHHFNTAHLEEMGAALVRTLCDYFAPNATTSAWELVKAIDLTSPANDQPPEAVLVLTAAGLELVPRGEGEAGEEGEGSEEELEEAVTDSDDESSDEVLPSARSAASASSRAGKSASTSRPAGPAWQGAGATSVASVAMALLAAGPSSISAVAADIAKTAAAIITDLTEPQSAVSSSDQQPAASGAATAATAVSSTATGRSPGAAVQAAAAQLAAAYTAYVKVVGGQQVSATGAAAATTLAAAAPAGQLGTASLTAQKEGAKAASRAGSKTDLGAAAFPAASLISGSGSSDAAGVAAGSRAPSRNTSSDKSKTSAPGVLSAALTPGAAGPSGVTPALSRVLAHPGSPPAAPQQPRSMDQLEAQLLQLINQAAKLYCPTGLNAPASAKPISSIATPTLAQDLMQFFFSSPVTVGPSDEAAGRGVAAAAGSLAAGEGATKAGKALKARTGGKKGRKRTKKSWGNPEVLKAHRAKADAGLAAALPMLGGTWCVLLVGGCWWGIETGQGNTLDRQLFLMYWQFACW